MEPVKAVIPAKMRASYLFAPYAIKLYYNQTQYVTLGVGSSEVGNRFVYYTPSDYAQGEFCSIGHFCESAESQILIGGEHQNRNVFNITLGQFPAHKTLLRQRGVDFMKNRMRGRTNIGSGVVISHNVIIPSGVSIGNGAVIGAGAMVTKDVPAYAIVGGNPARVIRMRFTDKQIEQLEQLRWWDWDLDFLSRHIALLNTENPQSIFDALDPQSIVYRRTDQFLCFLQPSPDTDHVNKQSSWFFVGVEIGGQRVLAKDLPPAFNAYVGQINAPESEPILFSATLFRDHAVIPKDSIFSF